MTNNKSFDDFISFGKDNVDAFVKSSSIAVKGIEELAKVYTSLANQSIEQTTAAMQALSGVKNPAEFQTVYSNLAKSNLETFVSETRKIQSLTNDIMASSMAPLNARVQALSSLFRTA